MTPEELLKNLPPNMRTAAGLSGEHMKREMLAFLAARASGKAKYKYKEEAHPEGLIQFLNENNVVPVGIVPNFQSYGYFLIYMEIPNV